MKKQLSLLAVVLTLGLSLSAVDAEAAKRFGGGKTSGMQRQTTQVDKTGSTASPASTAPTGTSATAAPAAAKTATVAPAAAASKRSWMGPIAGLAAGLGLAALASHLGFGEELASFMMMALLAMAVLAAVAWFMRKRAQAQGAGAPMRYAGMGPQFDTTPAAPSASGGSMIGANLSEQPSIPADFDTAAFERIAKVNFLRMQTANDAADLNDIRQFTSPEMFAEVQLQLSERGAATQQTRILDLDAKVLEVVQDSGLHVVSVRFTGQAQEEVGRPAEAFDEIWHLTKPVNGSTGWVIAGIQQTTA